MVTPTQIAVIDAASHDRAVPGTGSYPVRILDIGPEADGSHTLAGADVAAGALAVPIVPGSVLVTASGSLSVENLGQEPVIVPAGNGNISITIGSGLYAGTYTTRHDGVPLTGAMIETAPTCLVRPGFTGATTDGAVQTATYGLWIYEGDSPGDPALQWMRDGVDIAGETSPDYTLDYATDQSFEIRCRVTVGGVTVVSDDVVDLTSGYTVLVAQDFVTNSIHPAQLSGSSADIVLNPDTGPIRAGKSILIVAHGFFGADGNTADLTIGGVTCPVLDAWDNSGGMGTKVWLLTGQDTMAGVQEMRHRNWGAGTHLELAYHVVSFANGGTPMVARDAGNGSASLSLNIQDGTLLALSASNTNSTSAPLLALTGVAAELFNDDIRSDEIFACGAEENMAATAGYAVSAINGGGDTQNVLAVLIPPAS